MSDIKLLDRYRVDRADGVTSIGPEKLVILILKPNGEKEISFAISKMDAMLISMQLASAATEVQAG
jgi:hypothetical protein